MKGCILIRPPVVAEVYQREAVVHLQHLSQIEVSVLPVQGVVAQAQEVDLGNIQPMIPHLFQDFLA